MLVNHFDLYSDHSQNISIQTNVDNFMDKKKSETFCPRVYICQTTSGLGIILTYIFPFLNYSASKCFFEMRDGSADSAVSMPSSSSSRKRYISQQHFRGQLRMATFKYDDGMQIINQYHYVE